ncbi:MAG: orotidine-5'-phosphate decarboxylase [Firmicutes bacterium]|nr:orotidine-5'-phosphate decarboxylase [Bacillota bacterium]
MSIDKLIELISKKGNPTVVGLDPKMEYVPDFIIKKAFAEHGNGLEGAANAILQFNIELIDRLHDIIPAVKPQSAYYEMYGWQGVKALHKTIQYAKSKGLYVIADVKRNDIGTTAQAYAIAYLGKADVGGVKLPAFNADAATVNAYLGTDGIEPFLQYEKAIFVLVKTSNPSSGELQDLTVDGKALYSHAAALVNSWGKDFIGKHQYSDVGAVVGATYPKQLETLRKEMPHTFFLVPGYGAQGGGADDVVSAFDKNGQGAIINASRSVICAYKKSNCKPEDFSLAARKEAIKMRDDILKALKL